MDGSPLNRGGSAACSPCTAPAVASRPGSLSVISTTEIHNWMTGIEKYLNDICTISSEGKLNSEQKLRISNLCRKVSHGTSQLVVEYQSNKTKTMQAHTYINTIEEQLDLSQNLKDLKTSIEETQKVTTSGSFADMLKKGAKNFVQPINLSSVAIYPKDNMKSSEETKSLVKKIICPEQMRLQVRGVRGIKNGGVIISTDTKADIDKLKKSVQITDSGLRFDEPLKRKPRIAVLGVPSSMQENHMTGAADCPAKIMAERRYINS